MGISTEVHERAFLSLRAHRPSQPCDRGGPWTVQPRAGLGPLSFCLPLCGPGVTTDPSTPAPQRGLAVLWGNKIAPGHQVRSVLGGR